jgi:hypothetical protein
MRVVDIPLTAVFDKLPDKLQQVRAEVGERRFKAFNQALCALVVNKALRRVKRGDHFLVQSLFKFMNNLYETYDKK